MVRRRRFALHALLGLAVIAAATLRGPTAVRAYAWDRFYSDYSAEEMMRVTNLDRSSLGLRPLAVDQYLVGLAKNLAFRCPSTGATIYGRSADMATRDYFAHGILGCAKTSTSQYMSLDIMYLQAGYNTYRAENLEENSWSSSGWSAYQAGCNLSGAGCRGSTTTTTTVAVAERGFMGSPAHRADILGNYDRFGCGAWANPTTGMKYFTCLFSLGGPKPLDLAAPTFTAVGGSGATVSRGTKLTLSASFADNFRLSDGWLRIDGGPVVSNWAYDQAASTGSRAWTVSTSSLASGAHTATWAVRDVASHVSYRTVAFSVR